MYLHILKELARGAAYLHILKNLKSFGMCRYKGVSYLQKLKELKNGVVYLHIPKGLGRDWPRGARIGLARSIGYKPSSTLSRPVKIVNR
jgi:hypothetical protein